MALSPRLLTYLMSFLTLGIFWLGQETTSRLMVRSDRGYTWLTILVLMAVSLIPFSTAFLAEFIGYRIGIAVYWANLLLIGIALLGQWLYVRGQNLLNGEVPAHFHMAILRRILTGQTLYAVGAALCLIETHWSIGFIIAVQLVFAFAPRPVSRL